jgi:hypothetical protein
VYIDGAPAAEKQGTHDKRKNTREKAIAKGQQELQKLEEQQPTHPSELPVVHQRAGLSCEPP